MNRKPVKRAAILHDLCAVGKAAMTNILPVLSVMGVEACPIPTMALSTHTGGFGKPAVHSLGDYPAAAARHLKNCGIEFDAVFIGYLGSLEAISRVREWMFYFPHTEVLLDPIMGDHGRYYSNFDENYCEGLRGILHYSRIITPNYTESCFLAGEPFSPVCEEDKLTRLCRGLENLGAAQVVITSVPCPDGALGIAVYEHNSFSLLKKERKGRSYPGTGDLFASVLLGSLMNGLGLAEAADTAHDFVAACILESDYFGYDPKEGVLLEPMLGRLLTDKPEKMPGTCE